MPQIPLIGVANPQIDNILGVVEDSYRHGRRRAGVSRDNPDRIRQCDVNEPDSIAKLFVANHPPERRQRAQAEYDGCWVAVCLAVLRRDGFVALEADGTGGTVTTRQFHLTGPKLMANFQANDNGELQVDVLDESDKVVASSQSLTGNRPRGEFGFAQGKLAELQGKRVRLRFRVRNANFYSYWVSN